MSSNPNLQEILTQGFSTFLTEASHEHDRTIMLSKSATFSDRSAETVEMATASKHEAIVTQDAIQKQIRPLFGKKGINGPSFGDHPDYMHLKGTGSSEKGAITTLFIDIENSTRLNLLYKAEDVILIKNAFIRAAIAIIRSFDGHPHRIMGDAVMAYFGGKKVESEQGIIDAINCAAFLLLFVRKSVIPKLESLVASSEFGIRIGVDYGGDEAVTWSSYGFPGMEEVTATSFNVDVASKLQRAAPRNQMMIGDSLKKFIDLPADLLREKVVQRNGEQCIERFVSPNLTDRNRKAIDYKQHLYNWEDHLAISPLAPMLREANADAQAPAGVAPLVVTGDVYANQCGFPEGPLIPAGAVVKKDRWIKFKVQPPKELRTPSSVRFIVENHGDDAQRLGGDTLGNHDTPYPVSSKMALADLFHWEHAAYRGLHYMAVEISSGDVITHRSKIGVFIE